MTASNSPDAISEEQPPRVSAEHYSASRAQVLNEAFNNLVCPMRTDFALWPARNAALVGCALLALSTGSYSETPPVSRSSSIVGEWRGTSTCTNHRQAPACKDESVRYVFSASAQDSNTFHLVADRLESGAYQLMYEIDLRYSEADRTWTYPFDSPACPHCVWWYRIESSRLVGGITSKTGEALRNLVARRTMPPRNLHAGGHDESN